MNIKYLYAQWHKLEVIPFRFFIDDGLVLAGLEDDNERSKWETLMEELLEPYWDAEEKDSGKYLNIVLDILVRRLFNLTLDQFEYKSRTAEVATKAGKKRQSQYKETITYNCCIDIEFCNSPQHGRTFNRLTIQGRAFDTMQLDIGQILTLLEEMCFKVVEAHSRILLSSKTVNFNTIEEHFKEKAYTSPCKRVFSYHDPTNQHATTWNIGARPNHRNTSHSKRVIFYEADKIHRDLPTGTAEMELQLFGNSAYSFVYDPIFRDVDLTLKTIGVIRSILSIKTLSGDSNLSRRQSPEWWQAIVGRADLILLPRQERKPPQLTNQIKAFKDNMYRKKQNLGAEAFISGMVDFIVELNLTEEIRSLLPA